MRGAHCFGLDVPPVTGPDMLLTTIAVFGVPAAVLVATGTLMLLVLVGLSLVAGPADKKGTRR